MEETTTAITAVKQEVQLRDWAARIAAQQASGMSVQKWCAENGINPKTYYYHLRKLREKCVASAPAIVPLGVPKYTSSIHIENFTAARRDTAAVEGMIPFLPRRNNRQGFSFSANVGLFDAYVTDCARKGSFYRSPSAGIFLCSLE